MISAIVFAACKGAISGNISVKIDKKIESINTLQIQDKYTLIQVFVSMPIFNLLSFTHRFNSVLNLMLLRVSFKSIGNTWLSLGDRNKADL